MSSTTPPKRFSEFDRTLSALKRCEAIAKRASELKFCFGSAEGYLEKTKEELDEVSEAFYKEKDDTQVKKEIGDLLVCICRFCTLQGWSTEELLHQGLDKFEKRFKNMEILAGGSIEGVPYEQQFQLWLKAKAQE